MRQFGNSFKLANAADIVLDTGTGSKIGTSALQKLGFYGNTPITRPSSTNDIKQSLTTLGLLTSGGATPLNLEGGTLTSGQVVLGADLYITANNITQTTGNLTIGLTSGILGLSAPVEVSQNYFAIYNNSNYRHQVVTFYKETTDVTSTELTLTGGSPGVTTRWYLTNNTSYACTLSVIARRTSDGLAAMFKRMFIINNFGGTTAIQGNVQVIGADINPNSWSITVQGDNTNDSLQIMVIGANSNTIKWFATVEAERISV